jgi:hypothetical protein
MSDEALWGVWRRPVLHVHYGHAETSPGRWCFAHGRPWTSNMLGAQMMAAQLMQVHGIDEHVRYEARPFEAP